MSPEQILEEVLADPPTVHIELGNPEGGVWRTHRDCYELLARTCGPGARTLETGLGLSTALLVRLGAFHTCVTLFECEADRLRAYCRERGIAIDRFHLVLGPSQQILPQLQGPLDLVLIDGGHAFPIPMLDWYYTGSRLRRGGLVVIDDLHLPAVKVLTRYLDCDPRWAIRHRTIKWAAYERLSEGPLSDEWNNQPFYEP